MKKITRKKERGSKHSLVQRMEFLEAVKPYLQLGYSIPRACSYAGLPKTTLYTWISKDPVLQRQIEAWQGLVNTKARQNIVEHIMGNEKRGIKPDLETSKWWVERREKEDFSTRVDISSEEGMEIKISTDYVNSPNNNNEQDL